MQSNAKAWTRAVNSSAPVDRGLQRTLTRANGENLEAKEGARKRRYPNVGLKPGSTGIENGRAGYKGLTQNQARTDPCTDLLKSRLVAGVS